VLTDRRQEKNLLKGLLGRLAEPEGKRLFGNLKLTAFCAMRGENAVAGELMIIGRAVNGWQEEWWRPEDLNANKIDEIIKEIYGFLPMRWVTEWWDGKEGSGKRYKTRMSAFWRVVKLLTRELGIADVTKPDWSTYLIWSNLYKISPFHGGNPSNSFAEFQRKECVNLLKEEISQWQPKKVLFLTGISWADKFFTEDRDELGKIKVKSCYENYSDPKVQLSGKLLLPQCNPTTFVVAAHPQRKPELQLTEEIMRFFATA